MSIKNNYIVSGYLTVENPSYNPDGSICVNVTTDSVSIPFPYTAVKKAMNTGDEISNEIYNRAIKGEFGEIMPVPQERYDLINKMKKETNILELERKIEHANKICRPLSDEKELGIITDSDFERYRAWAKYRQSLRLVDVDVDRPEWPAPPE